MHADENAVGGQDRAVSRREHRHGGPSHDRAALLIGTRGGVAQRRDRQALRGYGDRRRAHNVQRVREARNARMPIHDPELDAPLARQSRIAGPGKRLLIRATYDAVDQIRQSIELQLIRDPARALFRQPLIGEERATDHVARVGMADDLHPAIGVRAQEVLHPLAEVGNVQDVVRTRLAALEVGDRCAVSLGAWKHC